MTSLSPLLCDPRKCVNVEKRSRKNDLRLEMEGVTKASRYLIPPLLVKYLTVWISKERFAQGKKSPEVVPAEPSPDNCAISVPDGCLRPETDFQVNVIKSMDPDSFQLMMTVPCKNHSGMRLNLRVLVDTGAQANLVRSELFSENGTIPAVKVINMVTAGGIILKRRK